MTEEEKEAIEEAKKQIKEAHNLNEINVFMTDSTTLKIILNLIDKLQEIIKKQSYTNKKLRNKIKTVRKERNKLQKENTELEEENKQLRDTNKKLYEMGKQRAIQELINENWVSKDKIREFKDLLLKDLDRDFVTEAYRQSISCYFDNLLKE